MFVRWFLNGVQSKVVVIYDEAHDAISKSVDVTTAERIIVASPGDSWSVAQNIVYSLESKKIKMDGRTFQRRKSYIRDARVCFQKHKPRKKMRKYAVSQIKPKGKQRGNVEYNP